MPSFVDIIEFLGTIAFAISGIRLASAKEFDWFGAFVVGMATAIGGGTIRDLLLDVTPFWMDNPVYLICGGLSLVWVVFFSRSLVHLNNTFFFFDTLGLALFTVVGMQKTLDLEYSFWVAIIMGTLSGVAGGIIRDVLINEVPLIFHKEVYAVACINGGIAWWILSALHVDDFFCEIVCAVVVLLTRFISVKYHWCLPVLAHQQDPQVTVPPGGQPIEDTKEDTNI